MRFQHTNQGRQQSKVPLISILSIMTLVALYSFFMTSWPYRGLILFVVYPVAFAVGVLFYHFRNKR